MAKEELEYESKDPCVLWYWNDWAGGTKTMSRFLEGCYMDLLDAQFNSESNTLSIDEVKTVLGSDFGPAWPTLQKKFKVVEGGQLMNKRLTFEKLRRSKYTKGRKKNLKGSPHMETEIETEIKIEEEIVYYRQFAHLKITGEEVSKLLDLGYTMLQVDDILDAIQNSKANTKYTSLFLTAKNWLKREHGEVVKKSKLPGADEVGKSVDDKILRDLNLK